MIARPVPPIRGRSAARATRMSMRLALVLSAWLVPGSIAAQEGCVFGDEGNDVLRQVTLTGGEAIYYVTRPHFVCEDGVQIWADSATAYTTTDLAHLVGSVRYVDPVRELRAAEARYFSDVGRLQATGDVFVQNRDDGSVIENGDLVYLRETAFRPEESMTVTTGADGVRPRATLSAEPDDEAPDTADVVEPDEAPDTADMVEPDVYVVEGDEILLRGAGYLRSTGSVSFRYDSVVGFADTLVYEEAIDRVRLLGSARVEAEAYDLVGREIDITSPRPGARDVRATDDAVLTGEDLVLTAPIIHLFARDDRLERLVALPDLPPDSMRPPAPASPGEPPTEASAPARPHAVADNFEITADSLEVLAPGEALERIFAAGRARSVSHARDSLNAEPLPDLARNDWLEGDTIIVAFAPETEIERIIAIGAARSLYRLPPSGPTTPVGVTPPAVHYVVGDRITIVMREGDVDHMEVEGEATGFHLEPLSGQEGETPANEPSDQPDPTPPPSAAPDTVSGHQSTASARSRGGPR